eukprot:CAMPEP_0184311414 /NCGR_PEP_ID=MMETSP1049-20130417/41879_1 /TAXON_ID=77928 /ORGANISM="Proteomonas sulcata, Strain CCMP704" /LENGTH=219 /DNA_ID=CAMNT_0026626777 /DNA_START=9 /DNA_END=668 /DNA_ORIENTATION=+
MALEERQGLVAPHRVVYVEAGSAAESGKSRLSRAMLVAGVLGVMMMAAVVMMDNRDSAGVSIMGQKQVALGRTMSLAESEKKEEAKDGDSKGDETEDPKAAGKKEELFKCMRKSGMGLEAEKKVEGYMKEFAACFIQKGEEGKDSDTKNAFCPETSTAKYKLSAGDFAACWSTAKLKDMHAEQMEAAESCTKGAKEEGAPEGKEFNFDRYIECYAYDFD